MKTNTKVMIDKETADAFEAWLVVLQKERERGLEEAFAFFGAELHKDVFQIMSNDKEDNRKNFDVKIDKDTWVLFKNRAGEKGYPCAKGVELSMHLFVKHYDNKLSEVL